MKKKIINFSYISLIVTILFFQNIKADEMFDLGKNIFSQKGNCAMCHTLAVAGSGGSVGPNLDEIKPSMMMVVNVVTNGRGVMPAYARQLSEKEIKAVAQYVSESVR